jgi:hypothetical protein
MATGDQVVMVHEIMPPATLFPAFGARVGGSTPAEQIPVWAFDAATIEYLDFYCVLQGYGGGGLTFTLPWMAATATTLVTRWGIAIRRVPDDTLDLDSSGDLIDADFNDVDCTAPTVSGEVAYDTITFTDGADMDNWANGELAIIRLRRNAAHANDTMAGDAQLIALVGKET